jgi:hypothetical protein
MSHIFKLPPLKMFLGILGIEAIFSLTDLSVIPGVMAMAKSTSHIFPVIENLLRNPLVPPSVIPYVALTCVLIPAKVYVAYLLILQLSPKEKAFWASFPSGNATLTRKIFSSIWVLLSCGLCAWFLFRYGESTYINTNTPPRSAITKFHLVISGGLRMWLGWAVMHLAVVAYILGLLLAFVDEWIRFIFDSKISNEE